MQRSSDCNDEFLTLLSDALSSNLGGVEIMQLQELFDHHDAHLIQEIGWELPGLLLPCACHESVQQRYCVLASAPSVYSLFTRGLYFISGRLH
jgi:hypothetical protein